MANPEHVDRLLQGVEAWNWWRMQNPEIKPDLSNADLYGFTLSSVNFSNTNLSEADLSQADLNRANLRNTDLTSTNLSHSNLYRADLIGSTLKYANLSCATLNFTDFSRANLVRADFRFSDLKNSILARATLINSIFYETDLSHANLESADLSNADLRKAILTSANLYGLRALNANFQAAILTGANIEGWSINSQTDLQDVVCEYIFNGYDARQNQFTDRRPHDPNQIFAPGEFTKRYQIVLETVNLFFNDGIDWRAFLASLQDLKTEYGEDLNIQGIEKKAGGSFVVRLEVPSNIDKGTIERTAKELYETNLQILEAKYHAELQAKDKEIESYRRESANMMEITQLLASRPIHVEAKAVAENQSSSETFNTNLQGATIGNFANKMQDQASQHATQNIGANLNEITTLIQSLRSMAESFPEAQRSEAIDHLQDLETDLQQPPEKRKPSRMKAALLALVGIAAAVSTAVANTNEFVGQVQELSEKLDIELPIEQVEPKAIDRGN